MSCVFPDAVPPKSIPRGFSTGTLVVMGDCQESQLTNFALNLISMTECANGDRDEEGLSNL